MSETLNLDDLAPAPRVLRATVEGVALELPVRGMLSVVEMVEMLQLEQELQAAVGGMASLEVLARMNDLLMRYVREATPDCPDLRLSGPQVAEALAFIAGGDSVTDVVAATITPEATNGSEAPDRAAPLSPSATPSAGASSISDAQTDGHLSGGDTAPGAASASTSETLTPV